MRTHVKHTTLYFTIFEAVAPPLKRKNAKFFCNFIRFFIVKINRRNRKLGFGAKKSQMQLNSLLGTERSRGVNIGNF